MLYCVFVQMFRSSLSLKVCNLEAIGGLREKWELGRKFKSTYIVLCSLINILSWFEQVPPRLRSTAQWLSLRLIFNPNTWEIMLEMGVIPTGTMPHTTFVEATRFPPTCTFTASHSISLKHEMETFMRGLWALGWRSQPAHYRDWFSLKPVLKCGSLSTSWRPVYSWRVSTASPPPLKNGHDNTAPIRKRAAA